MLSSSVVGGEIKKAKSTIIHKKRDKEGSTPFVARPQQLVSRSGVRILQHVCDDSSFVVTNKV